MSETAERGLKLVAEVRKHLDNVERALRMGTLPEQKLLNLESALVEMLTDRRWRPDFMGLTGPSGYEPRPIFEKCDKCDHYRAK